MKIALLNAIMKMTSFQKKSNLLLEWVTKEEKEWMEPWLDTAVSV